MCGEYSPRIDSPHAISYDPRRRFERGNFMARRPLPVFGIALLVFALLGAIGSAAARHRSHAAAGAPGDFAYYVLSLSWSPAFCLSSPGAAECSGPRRYGFIVHGLWPHADAANERGWPEHCDVHRPVPDDVVQGIADLMPARGLVYHEWSAHGTCSGLEPAEFFALVRRAYESIAIPQELSGAREAIEKPPTAIAGAFLQANPHLPAQSIVVTCSGQGAPRLREVHICLDRDLAPRACSADAMRGACGAPQVIIPPIR
jgi:ribonuclease T2